MRSLLIACAAALCFGAAASAASLDAERSAVIDQAAADFLTRAAAAHKSGAVPRQSDPAVGKLLDAVFDTAELSHGPIAFDDLGRLNDWLAQIVKIGGVYVAAAKSVRDFGLFGAELGRFADASVAVERAIADCVMAELDAHPGGALSADDAKKLAALRTAMAGSLDGLFGLFHAPGLTVGWVHERLMAMIAAGPSMARFLTPDQLARLRATLFRLDASLRDKSVRGALETLAASLATPRAPSKPAENAAAGGEIALDHDGETYTAPVRINGGLTAKFVLDTGAGIVTLPADLVERLTAAGAITPADTLGRGTYVTADGRRHRGARLMLRELSVGGYTATDVVAGVTPAGSQPLLGLSFLAKFKSWTLDNQRHVLIIHE
jgi:clan AA aspartic protease (TIGR02281 family)